MIQTIYINYMFIDGLDIYSKRIDINIYYIFYILYVDIEIIMY